MRRTITLGLCSAVMLFPALAGANTGLCIDLDAQDWLLKNERAYGAHVKKCHIDLKESDLIKRVQSGVRGCKRVPVASAFHSLSVAQSVIRSTIVQNTRDVKAWFRRAKKGETKAFKHKPRQKLAAGLSVSRKSDRYDKRGRACRNENYVCGDAKRVTVVLKKANANRCYILTAYPSE